jgi:DNA sulfur modification protein DndD
MERLLDTAICPTCGQDMHESRRAAVGTELGRLEGQLRGMRTDSDALAQVAAELQTLYRLTGAGVGPKIRGLDADIRRLEVELTKVENEKELRRD